MHVNQIKDFKIYVPCWSLVGYASWISIHTNLVTNSTHSHIVNHFWEYNAFYISKGYFPVDQGYLNVISVSKS